MVPEPSARTARLVGLIFRGRLPAPTGMPIRGWRVCLKTDGNAYLARFQEYSAPRALGRPEGLGSFIVLMVLGVLIVLMVLIVLVVLSVFMGWGFCLSFGV